MSKSEKTKKFEAAMKELVFNFDSGENSSNGIFGDINLSDLSGAPEDGFKEASKLCSAQEIEEKRQAAKKRLAETKKKQNNTPPPEEVKCTAQETDAKRKRNRHSL